MSTLIQPWFTPEQYLERERAALYKSEYVNGQILAMSGASREHNTITLNIGREISAQLRGRSCEVYVSDMRVRISATGIYTYPDVAAVCGEPHFDDEQVDTLTNPTLLIEVLPASTEAYDRGAKSAHYQRIRSLREYVFVAQDRCSVEQYSRPEGTEKQWLFTEWTDPAAVVPLASIGCTLRVSDIYDKIAFPNSDALASSAAAPPLTNKEAANDAE